MPSIGVTYFICEVAMGAQHHFADSLCAVKLIERIDVVHKELGK
jgi:hypothetical protein